MRWFGRLARLAGWLLVLAIAGTAGAFIWYRHAAQPPASGTVALPGLLGQVTIVRDGNQNLGVYAVVTQPGAVRVGDAVTVE